LPDASADLPPDARASLQDKVAALETEVADLKVQIGDLKSLACDYDGWFRRHISDLADHAAKEFVQKREIEILLFSRFLPEPPRFLPTPHFCHFFFRLFENQDNCHSGRLD